MLLLVSALPNILSGLRIILACFFPVILCKGHNISAFIILVIGAMSDFFDGYFARKFNVVTNIGALLDPLGDKIFINSVIWSLYLYQTPEDLKLSVLCIAILLSLRDCIMIVYSFLVLVKHTNFNLSPMFLSKICTTILFIFCILLLLLPNYTKLLLYYGNACLFLITITAFCYFLRYIKFK